MSWCISIFEVGIIPGLPLSIYVPDAPEDALIDPPCYCYLATDGAHIVLIDSGPDKAVSAEGGFTIDGETTTALLGSLEARGVAPEDVEMIVHTHLHYDHAGNDALFPNATVVVQREELTFALSRERGPYYLAVAELKSAIGERLRLIDDEAELFPGLRVLPNAGHTPGHQSVLVDTNEGTVCVCGDIVSLQVNVDTVGSVCPDAAATEAFLALAREAGWIMLPSHDPELRGHEWYLAPPAHDGGAVSHRGDR